MSIRFKIFGGFALMLAIAMVMAVNGWRGLRTFADSVAVATTAQQLSDRIRGFALSASRAVSAAGAGADFAAARQDLGEVGALYAALAGKLPAGTAQQDMGLLAGFPDGAGQRMAAYADNNRRRAALIAAHAQIVDRLNRVSSEVVAAQDARLTAAATAAAAANSSLKNGSANIDLAFSLLEQSLRLQLAQRDGDAFADDAAWRDALAQQLDLIGMSVSFLAAGLPPGEAPPDGGKALTDAYLAELAAATRNGDNPRLGDASERLAALAHALNLSLHNQQLAFEAQSTEAQQTLLRAVNLRNIAAEVRTLTQEALAAQLTLLADPAAAALKRAEDAADRIEKASRELFYSVDDSDARKAVADLRERIKTFREELPELVKTLNAERALADDLLAQAAQAVATAARIGDSQIRLIEEEQNRAALMTLAGAAAALAAGAALSLLIGRGITLPLARIVAVMQRLAQGDTGVDVPGRDRKDELRDVADTVAVFRDNAVAMGRMTAEREALKQRAETEKRQAVTALADTFEGTVSAVVTSLGQAAAAMRNVAAGLSETADGNRRQAQEAHSGAADTLEDTRTVAAAAEQLAASVAEIAGQVARSADTAAQAAEEAARAGATFQALTEAGERINDIIHLIRNISEQTNLLALNATIEAARAGEAGRGFAVVAAEVKSLANETARATDEVSGQIAAIQQATRQSADALSAIAGVVDQMNEGAGAIAAAVEEQEAVTRSISDNIRRVTLRTNDVSSHVAGVSKGAEKTAQAAESVMSATSGLARDAETLQRQVGDFLGRLRAG